MTSAAITAPPTEHALQRRLGLASATALVAGEAIAVGIFLTPAGMAKSLGSPFWLLVVWLVVGAMTLSGALCYGELAARFPRTGGTYVYLEEAYGHGTAFLYGWMCLLVLDPGLTAALATGTAGYAAYVFHLSPLLVKLSGVALIVALCALNILSIPISAGFLRWITLLKFGVLGLITVWAIAFRLGSWSNFTPFVVQRPGSLPLVPGLAAAMVGAFFSFGGWWDVSKVAGEIKNPRRTLPRALVLGVLAVTAVYVLISGIFLYLVPLEKVTSDETFVAQAGAVLFGPAGGTAFSAIVIICVLGSLAAFMMCAPRLYFAMAEDGLFLKSVAKLQPRFGTPARAILIQGSIASLLVFLGTFQQIISFFIFPAVAFLGLAVSSLFVFRRSREAVESDLPLAAGYPLTPILFLLLVLALLALIVMRSPLQALIGVGVVLLGLPVYRLIRD